MLEFPDLYAVKLYASPNARSSVFRVMDVIVG
jgi:hypothetical protein